MTSNIKTTGFSVCVVGICVTFTSKCKLAIKAV